MVALPFKYSLEDTVNVIIKDIKQNIIIFFIVLISLNKTKNKMKLIKNFIELDLSPVITTDANKVRIINEVRYILKLILMFLENLENLEFDNNLIIKPIYISNNTILN